MTGKNGGVRFGAGRPIGSGNKNTRELKEIARTYTPQALEKIVRIMDQDENLNASLSAAKELLDRGWGKPIQAVEAPPTPPGDDTRLINGETILLPLIPLFKMPGVK